MMQARHGVWALVSVTAALVAACGGESSSGLTGGGGGDASVGSGGASAGGSTSATGGSTGSGGSGGSGQAGAGGSAGGTGGASTGGATGAGGASTDAGAPCAPPANPAETALCVIFAPEAINVQTDPALDGKGTLLVQVFDTPTPPDKNAKPLVERLLPINPKNELSISSLPVERLVGTLPSTVYVRALFIDNPALLTPGTPLTYGAWIGGLDLTKGFLTKEPLNAVPVQIGKGNPLALPLTALRKLTVTVHASATPIGDGQGKLSVIVVDNADPTKKPPAFGYALDACADVAAGDVTLTGFVIGAGPYWVTGVLNDLGLTGDLPPGSLAALDFTGGKVRIPKQLVIAPGDYAPSASIDLSFVVPLPADAGAPGPNSCADLAGADGGVPADGGP